MKLTELDDFEKLEIRFEKLQNYFDHRLNELEAKINQVEAKITRVQNSVWIAIAVGVLQIVAALILRK